MPCPSYLLGPDDVLAIDCMTVGGNYVGDLSDATATGALLTLPWPAGSYAADPDHPGYYILVPDGTPGSFSLWAMDALAKGERDTVCYYVAPLIGLPGGWFSYDFRNPNAGVNVWVRFEGSTTGWYRGSDFPSLFAGTSQGDFYLTAAPRPDGIEFTWNDSFRQPPATDPMDPEHPTPPECADQIGTGLVTASLTVIWRRLYPAIWGEPPPPPPEVTPVSARPSWHAG